MSSQPFLPLFFGDLLAATPTWEGEARALYVLLLAYQWTAGPLPNDPKKIAKMCQYDTKAFMRLWATVGKKFAPSDDGLVNQRLEEHRVKAKEIAGKRASAGAKGAAKRWQESKQGYGKQIANAIDLSSHPSHPIPSQSEEEDSRRGEDATSVDKALYADARKIFGQSIGGQVSKAIKAHGKPWLLGVIEACRTKDSEQARAYFAAAMNGTHKPDQAEQRKAVP
jgi:uncharacterized protein YdaU (DUF1376 family)